jgi:hypothetical protein
MPNRYRCTAGAIVLFPVLTLPLTAQDPKPHVAVTGGLGNVLGGLGAGVEYYLAGSRISASGGLGFWPAGCDQATFAGAGALRGFAAISCAVFAEDVERHYGPGLSLGYRYIGSDGFTFTAAGGIGDTSGDYGTEAIILLGLGYTWRR